MPNMKAMNRMITLAYRVQRADGYHIDYEIPRLCRVFFFLQNYFDSIQPISLCIYYITEPFAILITPWCNAMQCNG